MNQGLGYELEAVMPEAISTGLLSAFCTIQQRSGAVSVTGQPDLTDWAPIPSLTNLPCQFSIQRPSIPNQNASMRGVQAIDTETLYHILLNGYYPQIAQSNQALVNGAAYEIMAVESDSQQQMTRLACRVYTQ